MNLNYRRKDFIVSVVAISAAVLSGYVLGFTQGQENIIRTIESKTIQYSNKNI